MNTDAYRLHGELPAPERPVLVVHLGGWIDASGAAAGATAVLEEAIGATTVATFDGDRFLDYRARRPVMELRDGVSSRLRWADIELRLGHDRRGTPVLLLTGPEPDSQWRAFAAAVTELALRLGVYQMVGLGAYPFATPHTRPSRLACTSPSADVVASVPYQRSTLDVPAGMSAVLEHALTEAGIASLGLWVQVPHYVSAMPYPHASEALLRALRDSTGIEVDTEALNREAAAQRAHIDGLVQGNDEHVAMVRQLETAYELLPSGEEIAAQFEQFLRDQGE